MGLLKEQSAKELPREKLYAKGPNALTDAELLALILRTGSKKQNVLELSRLVLKEFSLQSISRKTLDELLKFKGVKWAKAAQIVAVFELSRRLSEQKKEVAQLSSSEAVFEFVKHDFSHLPIEKVMAVYVNAKNKVVKKEFVFEGGLNYSLVDIRFIIKRALVLDASGFFLIHNHPSGDCTPSEDDIRATEDLVEACSLLNIRFLDHLVVGEEYFSFADNELI